MKFMEKAKRFFTLNAANHEGFTLVELIVVIAILAILAGVAVPAYSGYIKKAEKAGDMQLLGAINEAFAAACMAEDVWEDANLADVAAVNINSEGKIASVSPTDIQESFALFYQGNEDSAFKVIKMLQFNPDTKVFEEAEGVTVTIGDKTYTLNKNSVDAFKAATVFSENIQQMQGQVDTLAGAYGDIVSNLTGGQLAGFGEDYAKYMEEVGAVGDPTKLGNATVQYVANKTAGMTAQDAMDTLANAALYMNIQKQQGKDPSLMDVLKAAGSTGDPLSTAAMMYGAVTAYANGNPDDPAAVALKTQAAGVTDAASLLSLFQTASGTQGFLAYCGSYEQSGGVITSTTPTTQFVTDMNGYLGALDTINNVSGGVDIGTENVWSTIDVQGILDQLG